MGFLSFLFNNSNNKVQDEFFESKKLMKKTLRDARSLGTDLLEMSEHHPTCAECAKYQGRVFSISGRSKKFPKLPRFILEQGCVHLGCRHDFYPFMDGISKPTYHRNIVSYSNKPFVDKRTKKEIAEYEKLKQKLK